MSFLLGSAAISAGTSILGGIIGGGKARREAIKKNER